MPLKQPVSISALTIKQLRDYRAFAFPPAFAEKTNVQFLSFENTYHWVNPDAITSFFNVAGISDTTSSVSVSHELTWESSTPTVLKAYRAWLLPPSTAEQPFFEIDNIENWISDGAFRLFIASAPSFSLPENSPHATSTITKTENHVSSLSLKSSKLGKRKERYSGEHEIIIVSDSDEPCPAASVHMKKKAKGSKKVIPGVNFIDLTVSPSKSVLKNPSVKVALKREPVVPHTAIPSAVTKPKRKQHPKKVFSPDATEIKVTKKEIVSEVVYVDNLPTGWDVPRVPTAFVVDLCDNEWYEGKSIISMIRHEDQSSWGGSGGHAKGDANVLELLGEEKVRCRRAELTCNGVKVCEFFDHAQLAGYESYERNEEEMKEFWSAELDAKEAETRLPDGPEARLYLRAQNFLCKIKCSGKPKIRDLKNRTRAGKYCFIGCSGYRDGDSGLHRSLQLEANHDEAIVRELFSNGGRLKDKVNMHKMCSLIVHPRSHKESCAFTHIIDGKVQTGKIKTYEPGCDSQLIIFELVDKQIRKVVVIPRHLHNHPRYMHAKPTFEEKELVEKIFKASGRSRVTPHALQLSSTTNTLLEGQSWESKLPGMIDSQRLRKFIARLKEKDFPEGLDWKGVQHEADVREPLLPPEDRYIHSVTTKGEIKLIVTMLPRLVKHIHGVRFLAVDYTFKRVCGEINEWEIAAFLDRYQRRVTLASLYCNKATRPAFKLLFDEFFDTVNRVTGKPLEFWAFNHLAKLLAMLFDAEAAQMQALGDVALSMNNPQVSKIVTQDPQVLVQHIAKTCVQHFIRNTDKLPKNVPRDVIERLKSFPGLSTVLDIEDWRQFCKSSPYESVRNWYKQKEMYPWYLPSLNPFISPMDKHCWNNTPNDTNISESAHAARNAETGIGAPLLAAINDARLRDEAIAKQFEFFEQNGMLSNRWNLPQEREKRSASRRNSTWKKIQAVGEGRNRLQAVEEQLASLKSKREMSLERMHIIDARLEQIKQELALHSKVSTTATDLRNERQSLKHEREAGVEDRKSWAVESTQLGKRKKEIGDVELKGACARDSRPLSATPSHSPEKENFAPISSLLTTPAHSCISDFPSSSPGHVSLSQTKFSESQIPQEAHQLLTDETSAQLLGGIDWDDDEMQSMYADDPFENPQSAYGEASSSERVLPDLEWSIDAFTDSIFDRFLELYPDQDARQ